MREYYNDNALRIDRCLLEIDPTFAPELVALKQQILTFVNDMGSTSLDVVYITLDCTDIAMYLAIHDLVLEGKVVGQSPYQLGTSTRHSMHDICRVEPKN